MALEMDPVATLALSQNGYGISVLVIMMMIVSIISISIIMIMIVSIISIRIIVITTRCCYGYH